MSAMFSTILLWWDLKYSHNSVSFSFSFPRKFGVLEGLSGVLVWMLSRIESYTCSPRFAHSVDRLSFVTFILAFLMERVNGAGGARSVTLTLLLFLLMCCAGAFLCLGCHDRRGGPEKMAAADSGDEKR